MHFREILFGSGVRTIGKQAYVEASVYWGQSSDSPRQILAGEKANREPKRDTDYRFGPVVSAWRARRLKNVLCGPIDRSGPGSTALMNAAWPLARLDDIYNVQFIWTDLPVTTPVCARFINLVDFGFAAVSAVPSRSWPSLIWGCRKIFYSWDASMQPLNGICHNCTVTVAYLGPYRVDFLVERRITFVVLFLTSPYHY